MPLEWKQRVNRLIVFETCLTYINFSLVRNLETNVCQPGQSHYLIPQSKGGHSSLKQVVPKLVRSCWPMNMSKRNFINIIVYKIYWLMVLYCVNVWQIVGQYTTPQCFEEKHSSQSRSGINHLYHWWNSGFCILRFKQRWLFLLKNDKAHVLYILGVQEMKFIWSRIVFLPSWKISNSYDCFGRQDVMFGMILEVWLHDIY